MIYSQKSLLELKKSNSFCWNFTLSCFFFLVFPISCCLQSGLITTLYFYCSECSWLFSCADITWEPEAPVVQVYEVVMEGSIIAGGKGEILPLSNLSPQKAIQTIFRDITDWDIMIIFFLELHHSWTSYHSPFTDSHTHVNKVFHNRLYESSLALSSFLLPSHSYILKIIQKSKQDSCHQWHQRPQPRSCLCCPQGSKLARGCPGGLVSVHVDHHGMPPYSALLTRNFHLNYCLWPWHNKYI